MPCFCQGAALQGAGVCDYADTAVEALISINNQLRQPEAAIGILTLAQTSCTWS